MNRKKVISLVLKPIGYCLLLCIIKIKLFPINTIYYDIDTNYLHWSSQLPAFSVCPIFLHSNNPEKNDHNFIKNLLRPTNHYCFNCTNENEFPKNGYSLIVAKKLLPCNKLFSKCWWNGELFDCCTRFKYLQTKDGVCFSTNSEMTESTKKFEVSYFSKEAKIEVEITKPIQIYLHEVRDVAFIKQQKGIIIRKGFHLQVLFSSRETKSSSSIRWINAKERKCLLQGEKVLTGYRSYSRSACLAQITAVKQYSICGCIHHLLATRGTRGAFKECDIDGLKCLDRSNETLNKIDKNSCLPACEEIEPFIVWHSIFNTNDNTTKVSFILSAPPTERYILKCKTDLIGNIAALACLSRLFTKESIYSIFKKSRSHRKQKMIRSLNKTNYVSILY